MILSNCSRREGELWKILEANVMEEKAMVDELLALKQGFSGSGGHGWDYGFREPVKQNYVG